MSVEPDPSPVPPETVASVDLRTSEEEAPPWTGWDVVLIGFVAVFSMVLFSLAALAVMARTGALRGVAPTELGRDPRFVVPVQFAAYVAVIVFMYLLVRRGYRRRFWPAVRWNWPERAWAYLAGGVALGMAIEFGSILLPIPKSLPIEAFFKDAPSAYLMAIFGVSAAPLVEELFFRGFLYPLLLRRLGTLAAVAATAAAFALIHESQLGYAWGPMLAIFVVGLALTIIRARTGSVAAGFLVHAAYNLTLFVLLYISSDRFHHLP